MDKYIPLRGGGWSNEPGRLRSAYSLGFVRSVSVGSVGFRLILKKVETNRVMRGGSWILNGSYCLSSSHLNNLPDSRGNDVGFRLTLRRLT